MQFNLKATPIDLVDPNGDPVGNDQRGLLMYKGGKVCSEGFSDIAANFFCTKLGFSGAKGWSNGHYFTLQDNLDISIGGIQCTAHKNGESDQCMWKDNGFKCSDDGSVFLICKGTVSIS